MTHAAAAIVWTGVVLIAYVYIGYPLLLWALARWCRQAVRRANITPSVAMLISAYNEERSIALKLTNALALDYPNDKLSVWVISDNSTDTTDTIVESFADRGVKLLRMSSRSGKTVGLNTAVNRVEEEILIFSDANIIYEPDAIRRLVRNFADPTVGCVTGNSCYLEDCNSPAHAQESSYWHYEQMIRKWESHIGSTVGGDGAILAMRRALYRPLPADAISDLAIPLQIVAQGFRAIFEPKARGFEAPAGSFAGEFRRKRRIVNRSWRAVWNLADVLDPGVVGVFAWQVWSHKVLRWLVLPMVTVSGLASFIAAPLGSLYWLGGWAFIGSVIAAGLGAVVPARFGRPASLLHAAWYFYVVNVAAVAGIIMAIAGKVEILWTPERGQEVKPR